MIYKFWLNTDFFEKIDGVILESSNIDTIEYKELKKGWLKLAFEKGDELDLSLLPELKFYYDFQRGNQLSELLVNVFGLIIVSETVKNLFLENDINGIQYVPITIESNDRKNVTYNYYILNFLEVVDAINLENSSYDYLEEYNIYMFWGNDYCFEEAKIASLDIFKDIKSPKSVFVSEKIKKIFFQQSWDEVNFTLLSKK